MFMWHNSSTWFSSFNRGDRHSSTNAYIKWIWRRDVYQLPSILVPFAGDELLCRLLSHVLSMVPSGVAIATKTNCATKRNWERREGRGLLRSYKLGKWNWNGHGESRYPVLKWRARSLEQSMRRDGKPIASMLLGHIGPTWLPTMVKLGFGKLPIWPIIHFFGIYLKKIYELKF